MLKNNGVVLKFILMQISLFSFLVNYGMCVSDDDNDSPNRIIRSKPYNDVSQFSSDTPTARAHTKNPDDQAIITDDEWEDDLNERYIFYVFDELINSKLFANIIDHVTSHPYLRSLELVGCGINDSIMNEEIHEELIEWLKHDQTLEKLDLSHNPLNLVTFDYIAALRFNRNLKILNLNNTMTEHLIAPKSNYKALIHNNSLLYLGLDNNKVINIGLYISALNNNNTILEFNIDKACFSTLNNYKFIKLCTERNYRILEERENRILNVQHEAIQSIYRQLYCKLELYAWQQIIDGRQYDAPQQLYVDEPPKFEDLDATDQRLFYELGNGSHRYPR